MPQYSTADVLAKLAYGLSSDESEAVRKLNIAIQHAIRCAQELPHTLVASSPDPYRGIHARSLIVMKLQEADHWCLELIRTTVA